MQQHHDQAQGIRNMKSVKPVKVIAVASGKGGVGKTNVSVNVAVALAKKGRRVALLDADMGLANVDILLGIYPKFNLAHVLSGEKSMNEIMVEGPLGLKVIPGSSGIQKMSELTTMEQAALIRAFSEIDQEIDVLIVDTAAGISASVVNFVRACQEVMVVICDEPTSLTDAYAFIKLLNRDYTVSDFNVIANMVQTAEQGRKLFQKLCKVTDAYLDVNLQFIGSIPYDLSLRKSVQQQSPVVLEYPKSDISLAITEIAEKIDSLPVKYQAGGYLEFFIERMVQYSSHEDYV
ncbi:MinD/ParA family protein [Methylomicrobium sp. RS1]|jgi:flagellar biosynthesis protein FlhG|uniref:MinD/ParA family protein n=1 Tax=Candidatus Methylomicrobium oryzae TaxID=2802053 RepID=UPI002351A341|nr:MinD/ParA family protein [Methylomicrobium sp. RS1]